jgi:hypothetical protein
MLKESARFNSISTKDVSTAQQAEFAYVYRYVPIAVLINCPALIGGRSWKVKFNQRDYR